MPGLTAIKRRIQGQTFEGETYENLDLASMSAYGSKWIDCSFVNCDMMLANLRATKFERCQFKECLLAAADFSMGSEFRHVTFQGCKMRNACFIGAAPMEDVSFLDCQMQYASFAEATVRSARWVETNLHGADLRFIEANEAVFDDCVLWNAAVNLGCQFFGTQNYFDERSADLFCAFVARLHPEKEKRDILRRLAGGQMAVVERLMAPEKEVASVL